MTVDPGSTSCPEGGIGPRHVALADRVARLLLRPRRLEAEADQRRLRLLRRGALEAGSSPVRRDDDRQVDLRPALDLVARGRVLFEDGARAPACRRPRYGRDGPDRQARVVQAGDGLRPLLADHVGDGDLDAASAGCRCSSRLVASSHSSAPSSAMSTSVTTIGTQLRRSGSGGAAGPAVACAGGRSITWVARPRASSGVASTGRPRLARSRSARNSSADWYRFAGFFASARSDHGVEVRRSRRGSASTAGPAARAPAWRRRRPASRRGTAAGR